MRCAFASAALFVFAHAGSLLADAPAFSARPTIEKSGGQWSISFAASAATDVEAAVLDAKGGIVRHLVAGMLGATAPAPLAKDSLRQTIAWDGRDDAGKPVDAAGAKVRVRLGSQVKLDRYVGRSGVANADWVAGLAIAPNGELYVLTANVTYGRSEIFVLDKNGKHLRTVMPYPANTPAERLKSVGQLQVAGESLPVVYSGHGYNLQPLAEGMSRQAMLFHPKGHLVAASALGTIANHGPPRHLLAMHPQGGAPDGLSYVGPQILKPRGFLGGAGERGATSFDSLAASPDGEWIYVTTCVENNRSPRRHCVWRVKWADADLGQPFLGAVEAGKDDAHFDDPQGIATDATGNIYVCDRGNNRVMAFDAAAKLLGQFAVDLPQQIAAHPKTGEVYVVSRAAGSPIKIAGTTLLKFAAFKDGKTSQLAKQEFAKKAVEAFVIDPDSSPTRLWASVVTGWQQNNLYPIVEKDGGFELGKPLLDRSGLRYPMFVHADAAGLRLYVTEFHDGVASVDLKSGAVKPVFTGTKANEAVPGPDGNLYVMRGWQVMMVRTDADGKELGFPGGAKTLGPWPMQKGGQEEDLWARSKGPQVGDRGHVFAPNGDLYVIVMSQYGPGRVDIYAPDGTLKKQGLIEDLPHGTSGLGVDAAGNVYMGVNLKPASGELFPFGFASAVSDKGWVYWKAPREGLWAYPYFNTYLYHWGSVVKFSPKGGRFYVWGTQGRKVTSRPDVPAGAVEYRSGYLNMSVAVEGSQWVRPAMGPIPTTGLNWGDPSCTCNNSRLAVDGFGRVFAPDVFRFSVEMLDTAGNPIARIGRYDNADSAGPEPAFAWPAYVALAGDRLYVSDSVNRRVAELTIRYAAEADSPLP